MIYPSVQDTVRGWPVWVQRNLSRVVSHHPLRDVSIITWFAFLLGCRRFGERHTQAHLVMFTRAPQMFFSLDFVQTRQI